MCSILFVVFFFESKKPCCVAVDHVDGDVPVKNILCDCVLDLLLDLPMSHD